MSGLIVREKCTGVVVFLKCRQKYLEEWQHLLKERILEERTVLVKVNKRYDTTCEIIKHLQGKKWHIVSWIIITCTAPPQKNAYSFKVNHYIEKIFYFSSL